MKKIILATLSVLCLVSCNQLEKKTEKKNDLTEENLKGKVKSIKETPYDAIEKFGQLEKGDVSYSVFFPSSFTIYNEKGNKIEVNGYNPDGSLYSKTTYKYDEKGNKIEKNTYKYDGSLNYKTTYKYDEKGNKIEKNNYYYSGRLDSKTTYKYDEKGNNIEENIYYYDGYGYKTTYKYDEKGNKIEKNIDGSVDRLGYKYTYKYDEKGNTIEQNIYYHGSRPAENYSYKYEYDKNNNWTQEIEYFNTIPVYITERIIEYYP